MMGIRAWQFKQIHILYFDGKNTMTRVYAKSQKQEYGAES